MDLEQENLAPAAAEPRRRPRWWGLLLALAAFAAWDLGGHYALVQLGLKNLGLLPSVALSQVGLILAVVVGMTTDGLGFRLHFRPPQGNPWIDWVAIPAQLVWHLFIGIIFGVIIVLANHGKMPGSAVATALQGLATLSWPQLLGLAFLVAAMAAVFEELLFRGYFVSRLQAYGIHPLLAGAIPAVVFALLHVPGYGWLASIPKGLGLGLAAGLYVGWRQRLWPGMVTHFLIDFISLVLAGVAFRFLPH